MHRCRWCAAIHALACRWRRVGKFICIGLNYSDHAAEAGMAAPKEPIIFMKAISALSGPDDAVMLPQGSKKTDWEVELGIIIGARAQYVSEADAHKYIAGYTVVNDVSEREYQLERGGQWDKGKGCDTFGPVGPWLVTTEDIYDVQDLDLYLDVNGKRMQTGNTSTMIFTVAQIVSYLSKFMTLEPGDVIATGTPPGVGMGRKPQRLPEEGRHHASWYRRSGRAAAGSHRLDSEALSVSARRLVISASSASVAMNAGASRIWSPWRPSMVPPIG